MRYQIWNKTDDIITPSGTLITEAEGLEILEAE